MIIALSIALLLLFVALVRLHRHYNRDLRDLVEALTHKELSRRYPERGMHRARLKQFNLVISAFQQLTAEKEAQQHYLREMLELVDTGILAYNQTTHETLWMNDAFANMLGIPHIKNIDWLKKHNPALFDEIQSIPMEKNLLMTIHTGKQTVRTMTKASLFQTEKGSFKLIAFHNVSATMEEVESDAWKGLLSVMTHEIMNTIVPVSSLSETLKREVEMYKERLAAPSDAELDDMQLALDTIHRRSEGLLRFAETYRNLSRKIIPNRQSHQVFDLVSSIYSLMKPSLQQKGISFQLKTDGLDRPLILDRDLIEQVVINFITNAAAAVVGKENPEIHLSCGTDAKGRTFITVADNGHGIPDEIRSKIFIPFFSTRKNGNGIGLSISREIIKLHQGKIHLQTQPGEGSAFTILFD